MPTHSDEERVKLVEYDPSYTPRSAGMLNTGVMCYFNSLVQLIGSCPSVVKYIVNTGHTNAFLQRLSTMFTDWLSGDGTNVGFVDTNLFSEAVSMIRNIHGCEHYGGDQEDVGELFHRLVDLCGDDKLESLFKNRVRCDLFCLKCREMKQVQYDDMLMYSVTPDHINELAIKPASSSTPLHPLNVFIRNNYSRCDVVCEHCGGECIKTSRLVNVASVIIVCFNKFYQKIACDYPQELSFENRQAHTCHHYKLVASVLHYGSQNFGHYICRCLRREGIVEVNDQHVRESTLEPDASSYLLAYHFVNTERVTPS